MLRALLIGLSGLFVLAMIGASMAMNFLFGYGFGHSVATAWVWGGLSIASDGLKAVLPVLIAYQWRQRHWFRVAIGVLLLPLVLSYGFVSALGFWADSRGRIVDGRDNEKASVAQARSDVAAAEKRRVALEPFRLSGQVEADLAGVQREPQWQLTQGCRQAGNALQRAFCKRFDALRAELAVVEERRALTRQIDTLNAQIKSALANGAWRQSDPLAQALAWASRSQASDVRTILSWLAAMLVETVSCLGLLVVEEAGLWAGLARTGRLIDQKAERMPWRLVGKAATIGRLHAQARG